MTEVRIEISMRKRKNMDIPPEVIKIAKLDEKPKAINMKADTTHLGLQQPNPNQSSYNPSNISKPVQSSGQFQGIVGTAMLSDTLKLKKEKLDVHEYMNPGDIQKHTTPVRNPQRKIINSSAELQKMLSPKRRVGGTKAKQSLFGGVSSPWSSVSQMDNNEMLHSISTVKCEQMRKLDTLWKVKLPKNYADSIFQVVKALGYTIDTQSIIDINLITVDSIFGICVQYVPELSSYPPEMAAQLLQKMFC